MTDRYIEVIGESQYSECPETWITDIILNIQAANEDSLMAESREYKNKIIKILIDEGIPEDQLFYAGTDVYTPWWKKNKVGLNISHKVTIRTNDRYKAYRALEKTEELNKISKRITIRIDERKPIFNAKEEDIMAARKQACKNAFEKACVLASGFDMKVGSPIEIQELDKGVRGSGNYGDYDWGGPIAAAGPACRAAEDIELKGNERIVYLCYRIKFSVG
ncbi:MAG TPA: SIMPL domain-containing protein [Clostridia bacterium]